MNEFNEEIEFGIRRTSEDKLTYKNIIVDAINWCRRTRGTMHFKHAVKGLVGIINFDVKGYSLKTKIDEIQVELDREKKRLIQQEKQRAGRKFYANAYQAKFKIRLDEVYWNSYFECIIQLLADNNLLMETEKTIPVKIVGEHTNGSQ